MMGVKSGVFWSIRDFFIIYYWYLLLSLCISPLCSWSTNITCLEGLLLPQLPMDIELISKINQTMENDTRLTSLHQNLNVSELCKIAADIVDTKFSKFSREKRNIDQDFNQSTSKSTPASTLISTDVKSSRSSLRPAPTQLTKWIPFNTKQDSNATNSSTSNLTTEMPDQDKKFRKLPRFKQRPRLINLPNLVSNVPDPEIRRLPSAALMYAYTIQLLVEATNKNRMQRCTELHGKYDEANGRCNWNSSANGTSQSLAGKNLVNPVISYLITVVGNAMSFLFLLLLIVTFGMFRALRTRPGRNIMSLSVAMATSHAFQLSGLYTIKYGIICTCIAVFLHWIFLVTFTWMAIISFDLFITFAFPFRSGKYASKSQFKTYHVIALAIPTVVLVICLVLEFTQDRCIGYGQQVCFIGKLWGNLWSFILPVALVMFFNVVCLIATIAKVHQSQTKAREMKTGDGSAARDRIRLCLMALKVSTLTALGWIFGCIGGLTSSSLLTYLFLGLTSCQGVLVFLAFCCNQRVYETVFKNTGEGTGSSTSREKKTLLTSTSSRSQCGNEMYAVRMEDTRA